MSVIVDRDPCPRCATRGDIGCAHRAASGTAEPPIPAFTDNRQGSNPNNLGSLAFHLNRKSLVGLTIFGRKITAK